MSEGGGLVTDARPAGAIAPPAPPCRRARIRQKWERITWDEAATAVADAVLDAIAEVGPESVIAPSGGNVSTWGGAGRGRFLGLVGGITTDINGEINDFAPGHYLTYGTFDPVSSVDDWFHSELVLVWFGNPNYTRIPYVHYLNEARYNGAEIVTTAPDVSPSASHADSYVPYGPRPTQLSHWQCAA